MPNFSFIFYFGVEFQASKSDSCLKNHDENLLFTQWNIFNTFQSFSTLPYPDNSAAFTDLTSLSKFMIHKL